MAVKEGWRGRHYEDFEVGDIYEHPLGRTVLSVDNSWFTLLTQNTNPIHFDRHYAAQTEFGKPLVDSTFTLALVTGQSVIDLTQNAMANLGWDEVRLPNPLFEGDTVYSRSEVLSKRESKSRPNVGIVATRVDGKWFISPTRSLLDNLVAYLSLVQPSDLEKGIDWVEALRTSFSSAFEDSFSIGTTSEDFEDGFAPFPDLPEGADDSGMCATIEEGRATATPCPYGESPVSIPPLEDY